LQTAEHIVFEPDTREAPKASAARRIHATLHCRSRLRRRSLDLSIIDYYYLAVRMMRGKTVNEYVLDLRFIDPAPVLRRRIPWRWILGAVALTALGGLCTWWFASAVVPRWQHWAAQSAAALCAAAAGAYLVVAFRLIETVAVRSLYGHATLLEYTAGPGTLRIARPFMHKLAAHTRLAAEYRRFTKAEHLVDELRDHYRLMIAGVLSRELYAATKASILAQHAFIRRKN
jgi:hypothetical protein